MAASEWQYCETEPGYFPAAEFIEVGGVVVHVPTRPGAKKHPAFPGISVNTSGVNAIVHTGHMSPDLEMAVEQAAVELAADAVEAGPEVDDK